MYFSNSSCFYEPLAQRQQLFQFFDDSLLLSEGWEGHRQPTYASILVKHFSSSFVPPLFPHHPKSAACCGIDRYLLCSFRYERKTAGTFSKNHRFSMIKIHPKGFQNAERFNFLSARTLVHDPQPVSVHDDTNVRYQRSKQGPLPRHRSGRYPSQS